MTLPVLMHQRPIADLEAALSSLLEGAARLPEKGATPSLYAAHLREGLAELKLLREQHTQIQTVCSRERDHRMAAEERAGEAERERDAAVHAMTLMSEATRERDASLNASLVLKVSEAPPFSRPTPMHFRHPKFLTPVCDRDDPNQGTTDVVANVTCSWCMACDTFVSARIIAATDAGKDADPADLARLLEIQQARADHAMPPLGVVDGRSQRWREAEFRIAVARDRGRDISVHDMTIVSEEQAAYDLAHPEPVDPNNESDPDD